MCSPNAMPRPLAEAPRCGAKTRSGGRCRQAAMPNGRCRMHGGPNPGAPCGPANGAWRHGRKSRAYREHNRAVQFLLRKARETNKAVADEQ